MGGIFINPSIARGRPYEEELPPLNPRTLGAYGQVPNQIPLGYSPRRDGSPLPYNITSEGLDVAQYQEPGAASPGQVGFGPMTFSSVPGMTPAMAPQLRAAMPYPRVPGAPPPNVAASTEPPPLSSPAAPAASGDPADALIPGAGLARRFGAGLADVGRSIGSGIAGAARTLVPESVRQMAGVNDLDLGALPGLLPGVAASDVPSKAAGVTPRPGSAPSAGDAAAIKTRNREVTAASNPTVPLHPVPSAEGAPSRGMVMRRVGTGEPPPLGDSRNAGKKPGDRGYVYTNADLDRVREDGPSRGGYGTFTTPETDRLDKERKLEDMAMDVAESRTQAIRTDPTGEGAYRRRKEIEQEYTQRPERDALQKKEDVAAHADTLIQQVRLRPGYTPEQREAAIQKIQEWRDDQVSIIDPRYRPGF